MKLRLMCAVVSLAISAIAQDAPVEKSPSAKRDVGSEGVDIGEGTAKGAGEVAKGTGKAAGDLVTLHPIDAATDAGKGTVQASKYAGAGALKGTGKIIRGTGKAFKHLF